MEYYGIGLMSGSSLDGMDICAVKFRRLDARVDDNWSYDITQARTESYSNEWTEKLKNAENLPGDKLMQLNSEFGRYIGELVCKFIKDFQLDGQIQFVASHGHTVFHQPENGFTFQLGDGEATASLLSVPLVCNFRSKDVALGGVGAPLVPVGEKYLFSKYRFCLNLGGIANITIDKKKAFDICMCNMILNYLAAKHDSSLAFDDKGILASAGKVIPDLQHALNSLPFFQQPPPKALGREWFLTTVQPLLDNELSKENVTAVDLLRTAVEHITDQISSVVSDAKPDADDWILITGGGYFNMCLMEQLLHKFESMKVKVVSSCDVTVQFKEALIFAFLGLRTLLALPNVAASVTGASRDCVGGVIHLPGGLHLSGTGSTCLALFR